MSKEELSKRIKDIRINMKLTMEQFANKIHEHTNEVQPTKSNVSRWERGENVPNDLSLKAIADLAGITVEELLEENAEDAFFYTKEGLIKKLEDDLKALDRSMEIIQHSAYETSEDYEADYRPLSQTYDYIERVIESLGKTDYKFYLYEGSFYLFADSIDEVTKEDFTFSVEKGYQRLTVTDEQEKLIYDSEDYDFNEYMEVLRKFYNQKNNIKLSAKVKEGEAKEVEVKEEEKDVEVDLEEGQFILDGKLYQVTEL